MCSRITWVFSQRRERRFWKIDEKYSVSDDGIVWSDGAPLEPIGGWGVNLHGKRVKIAYLVARAFVPNSECREFVRHKNGDATDNRAENLEWCDSREKGRVGRPVLVSEVKAWNKEGDVVGVWGSVREASSATGVSVDAIRACMRGRNKTAGGLIWNGA